MQLNMAFFTVAVIFVLIAVVLSVRILRNNGARKDGSPPDDRYPLW